MRASIRSLVAVVLALGATCSPAGAAQGSVRGSVVDGSGGVLPGVTVVAASGDGHILATGITDAVGGFVLGALPPGPVRLSFELEGFSTGSIDVAIQIGLEARVTQRLKLATVTETVVVYGKSAVVPQTPPRPPPPLPPPAPAPVLQPVPAHDRDSICGPAKPGATADSLGTIRSVRRGSGHELYAKGDELVVDGGLLNGLEIGRNLTARRYYPVSGLADGAAKGEHTAGLLQIVSVGERTSTAVVVYACSELMPGDFLASFNPEPVRTPEPAGVPDYDDAARVLFADAGQMLGAPRRLVVIDRGGDYGIRVGQRVTLFRRASTRATPRIIGDAVVVAVRADSATIRLDRVTDAISLGDLAAPQRRPSTRSPVAAR